MNTKWPDWALRALLKLSIVIFFTLFKRVIKNFFSPETKTNTKSKFISLSISQLKNAANEEVIKAYTRTEFALELKNRVALKHTHQEIGIWAYDIFIDYLDNQKDNEFLCILLNVNKMEEGPENAISYQKLNEMADKIIAENE